MARYGAAVTDPSLIAELEGNQQQLASKTSIDMSKYKAVADPNILSQLNQSQNISNTPQNSILQQISNYMPKAGIPPTLNVASGLMSLVSKDPAQQNIIANLPQIAMGQQPTDIENVEHSIGKNLPSFAIPEAKIGGFIPQALSRIAGQTGWGALTNQNAGEGAKEYGATQGGLELLSAPFKGVSKLAEMVNPREYAGKIAEQIRNLAQAGKAEADPYYQPARKYFDNNVTPTPKKYLEFSKEDRAYFNAPTKKAYNDFVADPTLGNLHNFQSAMGAQPDLGQWREGIKNKIAGFLKQDPKALEDYKKGSDIMRDKYYPYVSTDELRDIAEHKNPIKERDPNALAKGLKNAPIVENSGKALEPSNHPLVGFNQNMQDALNKGQLAQYGIPMTVGALLGHAVNPTLGSLMGHNVDPMLATLAGIGAGGIFGKYTEPTLLRQAQNPMLKSYLNNIRLALQGAGRGAVGYNMYGQQ